jgi:hypothetical protein
MSKMLASAAVLVCMLSVACTRQLDKVNYIQWVQDYDNGLHVRKTVSEFVFDLQYQPAHYATLVADGAPTAITNDSMQYYVLKISLRDSSKDLLLYNVRDNTDQQRTFYYYSYLFQHDIFLEENGSRLPCVLFHFEQNDLRIERTFILGFEHLPGKQDIKESKLVIDAGQFGSLPIKISVSKENIPILKI